MRPALSVAAILSSDNVVRPVVEDAAKEYKKKIVRPKIEIKIAPKISDTEKKEKGLTGFVVVAHRWIVERSNAWMEKCRLLWKNCESKLQTSVAEIKLCFIRLILKRLC